MVPHGAVHGAGSGGAAESGADGDAAQQGEEGQPAVGAGQDKNPHGRAEPAHLVTAAPDECGRHRPAAERRGRAGGQHHGAAGAAAGHDRHGRHGAAHEPHRLRHRRGAGSGEPARGAGAPAGGEAVPRALFYRRAGQAGRAAGDAGGHQRAHRRHAGGRAAVLRPGGRHDPGGLRPGGGSPADDPHRRQGLHRRAGSPGKGENRHPYPEGGVQQGIRLLHRGVQLLQGAGARGVHTQADAGQRRAVHHPGAEGSGARGAHRPRPGRGAGIRPADRPAQRCGGAGDAGAAGGIDDRPAGHPVRLRGGGGAEPLLPPGRGRVRRDRDRGGTPSRCGENAGRRLLRAQRHPHGRQRGAGVHHHRPQHGR